MFSDVSELKHKSRKDKLELNELKKSHGALLMRYQLDLDQSEASMRLLRDQLDHVTKATDQARHERNQAVEEAKKKGQEKVAMEKDLRDLVRAYATEREQTLHDHVGELTALRSQWESERDQTTQDILDLKKSKVDLQVRRAILTCRNVMAVRDWRLVARKTLQRGPTS
jgi:uncharacterized protein (DUF3084 family)